MKLSLSRMKKAHIFLGIAAFAVALFFACSNNNKGNEPDCNETDSCEQGGDFDPEPGSNPDTDGNQNNVIINVCENDVAPVPPPSPGGTETGGCIPPPGPPANGASFPSGKETCIVVSGKCYKCNPERGDECLSGWLWNGAQVDSDWWWEEISCGGSGGAASLICSGFSSGAFVGAPVSYPTVKCGNNALNSSDISWGSSPANLNWSNPAQGCYSITATANCDGSSKTASCGKLAVNPALALTCANVPASGVAGQTISSPIVTCGITPVPFNDISWSSSPVNIDWQNPAANTYTNIKATPASGDCKGKQATCSGALTVRASGGISSSTGGGGSGSSSSTAVLSSNSGGGGSGNCGAAVNYPTLTSGTKGWTSRYWDGCKQSCSWSGKQQYPPLASSDRCRACEKSGATQIAASDNNRSSCDGGNSYTCFDFTPCKVNDNLAYAFAASPTDQCGKCFQIQFDGGFQHGTPSSATHGLIKGKTLIVMTSNMGGDVGAGQFDILIPGGGLGQFDSFSGQIGVSKNQLGETYGGLLSACEKEHNYDATKYASCLTSKCNVFTNATLKAGCLFYVDWFKAANNPTMIYKEVTCPQYLIDKYKATLK